LHYDGRDLALLFETWERPSEEWPNGRVTTIANGVLLDDKANPLRRDGSFLFTHFADYAKPGLFWGMGEIQQLLKPQDSLNKIICQIIDILNYCANPSLMIQGRLQTDIQSITNRPGNIYHVGKDAIVKYLEGAAVSPALFQLIDVFRTLIDIISGVHDITQGRRPTGITAGRAIMALQDAAQTRMRLKIRNLESAIEDMGGQVVEQIQQNYTDQRAFRITNAQGEPEWISVNKPDTTGIINDLSVGKYDIEVVAGSTMPKHKLARFEQGEILYKLGVIDEESLLDVSDWPNKKEVLVRMKQQEAKMQALRGLEEVTGEGAGSLEAPGLEETETPEEVLGEV